jgi:hypothetical protein
MKINIQIEDASREDLQRLFGEVSRGTTTTIEARPLVYEHVFAQAPIHKPGPNTSAGPILSMPVTNVLRVKTPTCIEETGCKDCKETGLTDACEKCSPPVVKTEPAPKKTRGNKSNKFGIPSSLSKSDNKAYSAAWAYCNAHGITYDKIGEFKAAKKTERAAKPKKPIIKIEGADNLVDKMPEIRPPIREAHKRVHEAVTAANIRREPPAEFKVGVHVRQIKPYLDRKVSGIGVVTALVKGLVEVNFNGSQYYKIAPDCLEVL